MTDHAQGTAPHSTPGVETVPAAWTKTELARHPQRPNLMDFIDAIFTDFSEIHGDRLFGDDPAMTCGFARFDGEEVMVIGTRKGRATKEKMARRFGMPNPEGYRKALRCMKIAEKFRRPILLIVDVPAAYPGVEAEERGQGEAIARNLLEMARLKVPTISVVTGEGGSGGALALAVADRVLILENAIYSVIPPEGCAAIMWRDASKRDKAAEAMRVMAKDVKELGCVDDIVPEPGNGAHEDPAVAAELLAEKLRWHLNELRSFSTDELLKRRYEKFRNIAQFYTA
ncbi:acetyl-CoA carboxylase carboxyltransferase subunit alpha [Silvibacterium sp.]|uniref:acetyl-CoA carboxylase carboxyltransferase subunit alpha n=1 Tax=Silvibacterium sp. TaxID=1964179 RepID=UPI0039E56B5A